MLCRMFASWASSRVVCIASFNYLSLIFSPETVFWRIVFAFETLSPLLLKVHNFRVVQRCCHFNWKYLSVWCSAFSDNRRRLLLLEVNPQKLFFFKRCSGFFGFFLLHGIIVEVRWKTKINFNIRKSTCYITTLTLLHSTLFITFPFTNITKLLDEQKTELSFIVRYIWDHE